MKDSGSRREAAPSCYSRCSKQHECEFCFGSRAPQSHAGPRCMLHSSEFTSQLRNTELRKFTRINIISSKQTVLCPRWRYYLFLKVACCKHNPEKCPGRGRPVFLALWAGTSTDPHSSWWIASLSPWEAGLEAIQMDWTLPQSFTISRSPTSQGTQLPFTIKLNTHLSQELGRRALKEGKAGAAVDASPAATPCQPDGPVDKRQFNPSCSSTSPALEHKKQGHGRSTSAFQVP